MKRILFLTSTNLAANPRLVKELRLATENGFSCTVVQFILGNWSDEKTSQIQATLSNVHFLHISALRNPFFPWFFSSVLSKLYSMFPLGLLSPRMVSIAAGKRSLLMLQELRRLHGKFDWVIAHNPAAFYPAMVFSKRSGAKLGIDVEDYHPGESLVPKEQFLMRQLMRITLPHADYVSFASEKIRSAVFSDMNLDGVPNMVVLNSFSRKEFDQEVVPVAGPLRLVWFSQFVDKGRGLEELLNIIDGIDDIELHLIGNMNSGFFSSFISGKANVFCHKPMLQRDLHRSLSKYDVGLALEPGRDLNNQYALSNKIVAYAQAGLYILASHTPAQDQFLLSSRLDYLQTNLEESMIKEVLRKLVADKDQIREGRSSRVAAGRDYDWEHMGSGFIALLQ